eukprot:TRINITY_DN11727_c0_g1_i1.p1 TRINITY_DN11727_c0_g1~~TRINITY_DN11727_c0_g1_i1.p1  ORF type:complete len:1555 (+),score=248.37 TRINITY_DN11727_c0_g1_i1:35-4699(+)
MAAPVAGAIPVGWHRDKAVVVAQSLNLIIALRTQLSSRSKNEMDNKLSKLMHNVKDLRKELLTVNEKVPYNNILQPFINVAKSVDTTGAITCVALCAFSTFLELRLSFVDVDTIGCIANAVVEAKSVVASKASHEAVLGRVLSVHKACVCHPLGVFLPEDIILKILEGCFLIAMYGNPSELVKHTAETTTIDMVVVLYQGVINGTAPGCFEKVFEFIVSKIHSEPEEIDESSIDYDAYANSRAQQATKKYTCLLLVYMIIATLGDTLMTEKCEPLLKIVQDQLCRALLSVLKNFDNVVVVAQTLRTLHIVVMTCGGHICPQLLSFIVGTYLKKPEAPPTNPDLLPNYHERREVILESLMEICSVASFPGFLVENYDLDLYQPCVYEQLCNFLSSACHPTISVEGASNRKKLTEYNVHALNTILQLLKSLSERCTVYPVCSQSKAQTSVLNDKKELSRFAQQFMEKPKAAVKYARSPPTVEAARLYGITPDSNGLEVGKMLYRFADILDKTMLGEYISEGGLDPQYERYREKDETEEEFNARIAVDADKTEGRVEYCKLVREGFYREIDLRGRPLVESMRLVLALYKLPGEAQRIDRLMEELAKFWYNQNPFEENGALNPFYSQDAAFVFSFSTTMLNTDLHNGQVENKMTLEGFYRNNRGTNTKYVIDSNGNPTEEVELQGDVPKAYQEEVYNEIKRDKLKMQDAAADVAADDFQWKKSVLQAREKGRQSGKGSLTSDANRYYDGYLFGVLINPAISALKSVTEAIDADAGGEVIVNSAMEGFYSCSAMASYFSMTEDVDKLVLALLRFTTSLDPRHGAASVRSLGKNSTGLLAISTLFKVIKNFGNCMRHSWVKVIDLVKRIFLLECLPEQRKRRLAKSSRHYEKAVHAASMTVKHANHLNVTHTGSLPSVPPPPLYNNNTGKKNSDIPQVHSDFFQADVSPLLYEPDPSQVHAREEDDGRASQGWGFFSSTTEVENEVAQARAATSRVWDVLEKCRISHILESDVIGFSEQVLDFVIEAILKSSGVSDAPSSKSTPSDQPAQDLVANSSDLRSAVFAVHRVADLLIANGHRYANPYATIENFYTRILNTTMYHINLSEDPKIPKTRESQQQKYYWISLGEHVALSKLRIFVRLTTDHSPSLPRKMVLLQSLEKFRQLTATANRGLLMNHFATAMRIVYQAGALDEVKNSSAHEMLIHLSQLCGFVACEKNRSVAAAYFDLLCLQVNQVVWPQNVPKLVEAIVYMYKGHAASPTEDADGWEHVSNGEPLKVVSVLTDIRNKVVANINSLTCANTEYMSAWLSVLNGFSALVSSDTGIKERSDALHALQRSIISTETHNLPVPVCYDAIDKVVKPLVIKLCPGDQAEPTEPAQQQAKTASVAQPTTGTPVGDQSVGFLGRFSPTNAINSVFGGGGATDSPPQPPMPKTGGTTKPGQSGIEDLQTCVLALLCKTFLHFTEHSNISSDPEKFMNQWKVLLAHLYAYYSRPPQGSEVVKEAVSESTRNVVNVLASLNIPALANIPNFWPTTRKHIAPFGDKLSASLNDYLDRCGKPA